MTLEEKINRSVWRYIRESVGYPIWSFVQQSAQASIVYSVGANRNPANPARNPCREFIFKKLKYYEFRRKN